MEGVGRASRRNGRNSHTREACTSESNPGRGADRDAQMGKPKPQGLASGGTLTSDGRDKCPSHPPFSHILVHLPILNHGKVSQTLNIP